MKKITVLFSLLCSVFFISTAFGYDASVNFKQQFPELVAGWYVKGGPTKGGPYPNVQDCGKPTIKTDSSYDCKITGYNANPAYLVVVPYDSAKKELAASVEATVSVTVPAPTDVKVVVTVTTISRVTRYGNVIADTTIKRESVPASTVVKEGTTQYRRSDGTYLTKTVLIFG